MFAFSEPRVPGEFDKHVGTALQALSGPHVPGAFDRQFGTLFKSLVIAGLCSTFLVLCAFAYTALHAAAKQHLNRVSFRLLICALVANLIYGCCFLSVAQSTQTGPSPECGLAVFLINISNLFSGGMFFCIALNLELVLVQGCNGKRLERYYLLGTLAVCAICNIPPYAAGQYGWNELNQACWFNNADRRALARWVIGTQVFWVLSMALGEAAAFSLIVRYFVSYENTQRRIHSGSASSGTGDSSCRSDRLPRSPVVQYRNPMAQYRNIILRVGLYPLVSCILSLSTIIDLYLVVSQVSHPIMSELNYRLSTAGYCIYALRPIIYAVLAATDPSFIRAVQELRRPAEQLTALQLQTSGLRGRFASTHTAGPGEMHIAFSREAVTTDDAGNTISNAAAEAPTGKEAPLQSPTSESRMDSDKMDSENLSAAVVPEVNAWDMGTAHALRAPALQVRGRRGTSPRIDVSLL